MSNETRFCSQTGECPGLWMLAVGELSIAGGITAAFAFGASLAAVILTFFAAHFLWMVGAGLTGLRRAPVKQLADVRN